jgi:hypothetical protein
MSFGQSGCQQFQSGLCIGNGGADFSIAASAVTATSSGEQQSSSGKCFDAE